MVRSFFSGASKNSKARPKRAQAAKIILLLTLNSGATNWRAIPFCEHAVCAIYCLDVGKIEEKARQLHMQLAWFHGQ